MDITEAMRRVLFENTFGLTASDTEGKAACLRKIGVPEEQITGFCRTTARGGCGE